MAEALLWYRSEYNNATRSFHYVTNASAENGTSDFSMRPKDVTLAISVGEAVVFFVGTLICITMTFVGNILVILSVFTYRPLRNVQNFFIVSLAVADLAVAVLVMPFNVVNYAIGHWVFGVVFCDMWLTCDILICTASILNLCAIALDRYWAIHDPINYANKRTLKRVLLSILIVWGASGLISIPPLVGWNNASGHLLNERTLQCELTDEQGFVIYSASGSFFVPLFIMAFVYIKIFIATKRRLRERAKSASAAKLASSVGKEPVTKFTSVECSSSETKDDNADQMSTVDGKSDKTVKMESHQNGSPGKSAQHNINGGSQLNRFLEEKQRISLSKERRAARTLGIIMGVFVLCWLPFFLMYVIFPFCPSCAKNTDVRIVNFITWLGYINSAMNPVIYTVFNIDFRKSFRRLIFGRRRGR